MPYSSGPNTVSDSIVFNYDTGDTVNSYVGEPTTNQFTNPAFTNGTTGWIFGSWDGTRYAYTVENTVGPFGQIVPALKITRVSSDTSYAHFHQGNNGKYTNGNTYTLSAYVKGSGTLGQYNQGGYGPITYNPNQFVTLTSNWQRISYTLTSQTDTLYPYWAAENIAQNIPMYFTFAQSENKTHTTPFVNGTRSITQGLLDISGYSNTITLANMSYDNNAQVYFDGTDDYTTSTTYTQTNTGALTIDVWTKPNSTTQLKTIVSKWGASGLGNFSWLLFLNWFAQGNIYFLVGNGSGNGYSTFSIPHNLSTSQYTNFTVTYINGWVNMYRNGVLVTSDYTPYTTLKNVTTPLTVGADWDAGSLDSLTRPYSGVIPSVRLYSRALSTTEIQQNYLAYKTRFNLS